ncbi:unnamed protein product [Agarophyton chilense]
MFAFVGFCPSPFRASAFTGAQCKGFRRLNRTYPRRSTSAVVVAVTQPITSTALLLTENITRRIFLGGISIVVSGILGVVFVAYFVARNYDEMEAEFQNRDGAVERLKALEELKAARKREKQS